MATPPWKVRLHRDLKDLAKEPLKGIDVVVDEQDMQRMCLVLSPLCGPYQGLKLHLDVKIPAKYPTDPPKVTIQTPVPHPNVIGSWICCDILNHQFFGGYTPGYLLGYVFLQLLSLFSSDNIEQSDGGGNVNLQSYSKMYLGPRGLKPLVERYRCPKCGFNVSFSAVDTAVIKCKEIEKKEDTNLFGVLGLDVDGDEDVLPLEALARPKRKQHGKPALKNVVDMMCERLNVDCRMEIIDKLDDREIMSVKAFDKSVEIYTRLLERRLKCFFLRKTFREKDVVLGIGVNLDSLNKLKPTVVSLDVLSHESFSVYSHNKSLLGVSFQYFLPLALDDEHFKRAKGLMQSSLMNLVHVKTWSPQVVLETLPVMMNLMVLRLVQSCDRHKASFLKSSGSSHQLMKASEFALEGYCLLYHLFSKLVRDDQELANLIQQKVQDFIDNIELRGKNAVPDLGEFLTYLLVTKDVEWQPKDKEKPQVSKMFLGESLTRRVLWCLKDFPHLAYIEPENYPSELRIRQTFQACKTSMKLILFQVNFFNMTRSTEEFDQRYGFPSEAMTKKLMRLMKDVYKARDWDVYFRIFGLEFDSGWKWQLVRLLKKSIESSEKRGYHVLRYTQSELYELRRAVEPTCPPPQGWVNNCGKYPVPQKSFFPGDETLRPPKKGPLFHEELTKDMSMYKARDWESELYELRNWLVLLQKDVLTAVAKLWAVNLQG
ncbi:hypothetical protein SELMODRAFT_404748 [Selaginella moellendorffii]|uniref:UBC core domain-containing protein n=1 Tax=Selaginella moellendorffii TaxID=88036 RepID=D8QW96_SELML|nr:hypothetical protein SELMODRAFT_404748 [Selaginella moellendorffii]